MSSYPTRDRKFQKNSKKLNNTNMDSLHAKISWQWQTKRENKKNRYDEFLPVQKNSKN